MNTFSKDERLCRRTLIERLFTRASRSFNVFPLRVIYLPCHDIVPGASILISVSKRHFKRAVKRNRVKRQIREAYRLNKSLLGDSSSKWLIAFIYLSDELSPSQQIADAVRQALQRIGEEQP